MVTKSDDFLLSRRGSVVATANSEGLLVGSNNVLGVLFPHPLVIWARARNAIIATTDLVEITLEKLAFGDDFGCKFYCPKSIYPGGYKA